MAVFWPAVAVWSKVVSTDPSPGRITSIFVMPAARAVKSTVGLRRPPKKKPAPGATSIAGARPMR